MARCLTSLLDEVSPLVEGFYAVANKSADDITRSEIQGQNLQYFTVLDHVMMRADQEDGFFPVASCGSSSSRLVWHVVIYVHFTLNDFACGGIRPNNIKIGMVSPYKQHNAHDNMFSYLY